MKPLLLLSLLLSAFALSQTPDPTPFDGRIRGTVVGADGKPISDATVSFVEQSLLSITNAYPLQVKADLRGQFDSGETLRHGIYEVYARSEKDGYPDRSSTFYRLSDFQPQTVQLFGAKPEVKVDIKLEDNAGVLTGTVIDGDTDKPLDAFVNLINTQVDSISNRVNSKHTVVKNGKFRELVPENTDILVYVQKPTRDDEPDWSHFSVTVHLKPGEVRNLDVRLYQSENTVEAQRGRLELCCTFGSNF